jgi:predicted RNA-binding Zn-ribbon protein involved in translation (DUF1610 family)
MRIRRQEPVSAGSQAGLDLLLLMSCPQCQARLAIDEAASTASCSNCGGSFLVGPRVHPLAVVVAPVFPADEARRAARSFLRAGGHRAQWVGAGCWYLIPYWRYRAKAFRWLAGLRHGPPTDAEEFRNLEFKAFDLLLPAAEAALPASELPPRPGILNAYPLTPRLTAGARVEAVNLTAEMARDRAREEVEVRSGEGERFRLLRSRQVMVGEEVLLVYLPFFSLDYRFRGADREVLVDGMLGEVVAHRDNVTGSPEAVLESVGADPGSADADATGPEEEVSPGAVEASSRAAEASSRAAEASSRAAEESAAALAASEPGTSPLFLPSLCPTCSGKLRIVDKERVHPCDSCGRAWEMTAGKLREVPQRLVVSAASGPDASHLPFWSFLVVGQGLGPLPGFSATDDAVTRLEVYVPAFESAQVERLSHLGVHLTRSRPDYRTESISHVPSSGDVPTGLPPSGLGATLGRGDGERLAWVIIGSLASVDSSAFCRFVEQSCIEIEAAELRWLPFRRSGLYLREPVSGALVRNTQADVPAPPADAQEPPDLDHQQVA